MKSYAIFRYLPHAHYSAIMKRSIILNMCKKVLQTKASRHLYYGVVCEQRHGLAIVGSTSTHHLDRLAPRNSGRHEVDAWTPWQFELIALYCSPDDWVNWVRRFDKMSNLVHTHDWRMTRKWTLVPKKKRSLNINSNIPKPPDLV